MTRADVLQNFNNTMGNDLFQKHRWNNILQSEWEDSWSIHVWTLVCVNQRDGVIVISRLLLVFCVVFFHVTVMYLNDSKVTFSTSKKPLKGKRHFLLVLARMMGGHWKGLPLWVLAGSLPPRPHLSDSKFYRTGRNRIQRGTPVGNRSKHYIKNN